MAQINLMYLYQDRFQGIQEFSDQYIAMRKVWNELELHFGRCESDAEALLKEIRETNPTEA